MFEEGLGLLETPINNLADGFNNFIEGIGDFFSNLIDSLGNWFDDIWEALWELSTSIGNWFEDLGDNIGGFFRDLSDSFSSWFEQLFNDLLAFGDRIGEFFRDLRDNIAGFFSEINRYLNPSSEDFFLKLAFIPSEGFIHAKFNELRVVFDERLPIIGTLTELFNSITQVQNIDSTKPKFTMELPGKWGGKTVEIINFDVIDPYVPFIKTFIRFLIWIPFIIKIYKRLPQIIY